MKLAMRQLPAVGEAAPVSKPYLAFSSTGHDLNMTHDLPVSKPFGPAGELCVLYSILVY